MTTGEPLGLKFSIGDKVVHPQHGVGFVAGLEEKQFGPNAARMYYVVSIPEITLWVPVEQLSASGLRKLSQVDELEQCLQILRNKPKALNTGKELQTSLSTRIKQGTMVDQCEVVRDLTALGSQKPLYGSLADFQRAILDVLCQEWAAVKGITVGDASYEINDLLKKGRQPNGASEPGFSQEG
jgi:RNA polymerase-interacting CarD/CdnL/TRCF family regulator